MVRNRLKRWIREYFQNHLKNLEQSSQSEAISGGYRLQVVLFGKNKVSMKAFEKAEFTQSLDVGMKRVLKQVKNA